MINGVLQILPARILALPAPLLLLSVLVAPAVSAQEQPGLTIEGVDGSLLDNLRAHLVLPDLPCDTPRARLRRALPELQQAAGAALNAYGYYHARVALGIGTTEAGTCWQLQASVEPGTPVRLREVRLDLLAGSEAETTPFRSLVNDSGLVTGARLDHAAWESLKTALTARATDLGYFEARFDESVIALDLPARAADLSLRFDAGPRYRFGEFSIDHAGILSDRLLRDMLEVEEGTPYSTAALAEVRDGYDKSRYFSRVRVSPRLGDAVDGAIPVDIELGLRPRHSWSSGIGFTTDTGPRARAAYENRYLNSRGHRLQADLSVSAIRGELGGSYSVPLNHPIADEILYSARYILEDDDVYRSSRLLAGISLPGETRSGWQRTISLDLQRDDYTTTAGAEDISWLILPGISFSRSRADDFINPMHGWKLLASLKGSNETLLSDTTLLQFYGNAKWVEGSGRWRMLARGEFGATWIDQSADLPASLRYYTGGDQSVRGYDFRAIGPVDAEGNPEGGAQLAVASFEVDYRFRDRWRLALFTDAGSAFDTMGDLDPKYSVGIGLRWLSPIGPLRFDLAHPLNSDESFRIHITMGPDL